MLQRIWPSGEVGVFGVLGKNLDSHRDWAVEWRVADMMIQTNAMQNAAVVVKIWSVRYLRNVMGFSCENSC